MRDEQVREQIIFFLSPTRSLFHWAVKMVQNRQILVQVGGGEAIFLLPDVYMSLWGINPVHGGTGTGTLSLPLNPA